MADVFTRGYLFYLFHFYFPAQLVGGFKHLSSAAFWTSRRHWCRPFPLPPPCIWLTLYLWLAFLYPWLFFKPNVEFWISCMWLPLHLWSKFVPNGRIFYPWLVLYLTLMYIWLTVLLMCGFCANGGRTHNCGWTLLAFGTREGRAKEARS